MKRKSGLSGGRIHSAAYVNSFRSLDPYVISTGLRTNDLRIRDACMVATQDASQLFLENSKFKRNDRETELSIRSYFTDEMIVTLSLNSLGEPAGARQVQLPVSAKMRMHLDEAIKRRRSIRKFTGDPVDLPTVAALVRASSGVSGNAVVKLFDPNAEPQNLRFRTVPSAGGLYPVETIVVAYRVRELERALYTYRSEEDVLELYELSDPTSLDQLYSCFGVDESDLSITRSSLMLLFVAYPQRSTRKYGTRGLRFVLHELGGISQNVHLACAALGLGSVDCSTYFDHEADRMLGLDGISATLVHAIVIGHSATT